MLHFFINTGIYDTAYYWNELHKCLRVYCELKRECPELGHTEYRWRISYQEQTEF